MSTSTAPFGIEIGRPLQPQNRASELESSKWLITPPKPHPAFSEYYAEDSSAYGVVWLKGVSRIFENDAFGLNVRQELEKVSSQLSSRYGSPRKCDILHQGSIWDDPRYWVASLHENERSFFHIWDRQSGSSLPDNLNSIFISLIAYNHSDAAIGLEYSSVNFDAAHSDKDADLASLL